MTKTGNIPDKRNSPRFDMDDYPATIISPELGKTNTVIGNLCVDGVLIKCNKALATILTKQHSGFVRNLDLPHVELHAVFPYRKNLKKLDLTCKVIYSARALKESEPERAMYIGLKILEFAGSSETVLNEMLAERKLPKLQVGQE